MRELYIFIQMMSIWTLLIRIKEDNQGHASFPILKKALVSHYLPRYERSFLVGAQVQVPQG